MAFQFQCPNGHLLEAEESQAGDQCNCPHCSVLFIIPASPHSQEAVTQAPDIRPTLPGDVNVAGPQVVVDPTGEKEQLFHIPCPSGHVLDTPPDMLGEEVLCPHCDARFRLRERDSAEYKRKQRLDEERKEAKASKMWLNWAIVFAVIVVLGLFFLIIMS